MSTGYTFALEEYTEDFFEECKFLGVQEVSAEVFEAVVRGMCAEEANQNPTHIEKVCMVEVLQDICHGYAKDGKFYVSNSYVERYPIGG